MSSLKFDIAVAVLLIAGVIALLPTSPFQAYISSIENIGGLVNMRYVNWFIPFSSMIAVGQAWLLCISAYYMYEYIARFVKLIS